MLPLQHHDSRKLGYLDFERWRVHVYVLLYCVGSPTVWPVDEATTVLHRVCVMCGVSWFAQNYECSFLLVPRSRPFLSYAKWLMRLQLRPRHMDTLPLIPLLSISSLFLRPFFFLPHSNRRKWLYSRTGSKLPTNSTSNKVNYHFADGGNCHHHVDGEVGISIIKVLLGFTPCVCKGLNLAVSWTFSNGSTNCFYRCCETFK